MRIITVRIIRNNDKRCDNGSAIARLASADIEVRLDDSPFDTRHKFAMFGGKPITNGSLNGARTASMRLRVLVRARTCRPSVLCCHQSRLECRPERIDPYGPIQSASRMREGGLLPSLDSAC